MNVSKIPVKDLYSACEMMLRDHWGYIWGASGELWTEAKQKAATREMTVKYGARWIGHRVADCSGVMVWIWKQHGMSIYHGSNTIRKRYCGELTRTPVPGYAAFKVKGDDYHHIGIVAADGLNVYESKGTQTGFVMSAASSWDCFAAFNDVDYAAEATTDQGGEQRVIYQAEVTTKQGKLNLRNGPGTQYALIGQIPKGEVVDVMEEKDGWAHIIDGHEGWSSLAYLTRLPDKPLGNPQEEPETKPTDDRPNETEKWIVVIPCESEDEAMRYAGSNKSAMILRTEKPPDEQRE